MEKTRTFKRNFLLVVFLSVLIVLSSVTISDSPYDQGFGSGSYASGNPITIGTLGAIPGRLGCENKRIGLVGASNTVTRGPGGGKVQSPIGEILQNRCPGSTVFTEAVGQYHPKIMPSLVTKVLANPNLNYVILNPSANGQPARSGYQPGEYKEAVIRLAQMVKDKDRNIQVIILTNTPLKGALGEGGQPSDYGNDDTVRKVKAFNNDLLTTRLGRSDLINHAVDTYSVTEDPSGSDRCGRYCPTDNLHYNVAGREAIVDAIINTVFRQPATAAPPPAQQVTQGPVSTPAPTSPITPIGSGCQSLQRCKEIDEVWSQFLGTGIRGSTNVWDPAIGFWREYRDYLQETQPSVVVTPGVVTPAGPCPPEMANIDNRYCIDKWEATVIDKNTRQEASPYYNINSSSLYLYNPSWQYNTYKDLDSPYPMPTLPEFQKSSSFVPMAVSKPGVYPQGFVTQPDARAACVNAGKRLCTEEEWYNACVGPTGPDYSSQKQVYHPYGPTYEQGRCNFNIFPETHPFFQSKRSFIQMQAPRLGLAEVDGRRMLAKTGEYSGCTNAYGVFDMVGNQAEFVDDPPGGTVRFLGSFYSREQDSPKGCAWGYNGHDEVYHDYSFGFRCCKEVSVASAQPGALPTTPTLVSSAGPTPTAANAPSNQALLEAIRALDTYDKHDADCCGDWVAKVYKYLGYAYRYDGGGYSTPRQLMNAKGYPIGYNDDRRSARSGHALIMLGQGPEAEWWLEQLPQITTGSKPRTVGENQALAISFGGSDTSPVYFSIFPLDDYPVGDNRELGRQAIMNHVHTWEPFCGRSEYKTNAQGEHYWSRDQNDWSKTKEPNNSPYYPYGGNCPQS